MVRQIQTFISEGKKSARFVPPISCHGRQTGEVEKIKNKYLCVCVSIYYVCHFIDQSGRVCVFDYYGSLQGIGSRRKKELDGATSLCNTNSAAIRFFLFRGIALTFQIPLRFRMEDLGDDDEEKRNSVEGGAGS